MIGYVSATGAMRARPALELGRVSAQASTVAELPAGTVTFLFTDVEGSTRLLDELGPERYGAALLEHRRLLREATGRESGSFLSAAYPGGYHHGGGFAARPASKDADLSEVFLQADSSAGGRIRPPNRAARPPERLGLTRPALYGDSFRGWVRGAICSAVHSAA